jgi:hypothetical protein
VALPVKALKAGQEAYWLDQIARNREEYFSGRGESPGRFVGRAVAAAGLDGIASPEQVRAMFQGLDPATGEVRCAPLPRADPRSKLTAGPLLEALKVCADQQGVQDLEELAGSKALHGDVRSVQAACRLGGARRVKVETVERLCRKVPGRVSPLADATRRMAAMSLVYDEPCSVVASRSLVPIDGATTLSCSSRGPQREYVPGATNNRSMNSAAWRS